MTGRDLDRDASSPIAAVTHRLEQLRQEIARAAAENTRVWSVDGALVSYDMVTDEPFPVGGYARVETNDGDTHLVQITSGVSSEREGPTIAVSLAELDSGLPSGATAQVRLPTQSIAGTGVVLRSVNEHGELGPPTRRPFHGAEIAGAGDDLLASVAEPSPAAGRVALGHLLTAGGVEVSLAAKGFGRHTFICGQSGSGKTYTLGKILEQLLLTTDLPIVILDPNSDYVALSEPRDRAETGLDPQTYDRFVGVLDELRDQIVVLGAGDGEEGSGTLKAVFGRLAMAEQAMVLGLDPVADVSLYAAFREAADTLGGDYTLEALLEVLDRGGEEARLLAARVRNLGVQKWSIWAQDTDVAAGDRVAQGYRAAVFDLGAVPLARERAVASAAVLARLWEWRHDRRPTLVVIDEAHNVCPAEAKSDAESVAAELVVRIAAEGRKYGLYLVLSTQEPHKVHPDALSQCANLILMRTTSRAALAQLESVFSDIPPGLLRLAPEFGLGEGVVAGRVAPHPLTFKTAERLTRDGGRDVPADWVRRGGGDG